MQLSLIAMSGSGKSYWAAKLAESGFKCFSCDDRIASKLATELTKPDGTVMPLGQWMGFPYDPNYAARESQYLSYEKQVLNEILKLLETNNAGSKPKLVIDTTGSVIYTAKKTLDKLRRYTRVVHLATPAEIQNQMFRADLARPRPVLWQGKFIKKPDETNTQALARCYPDLLAHREGLYKRLAHVSIDYDKYRKRGFTVTDFLKAANLEKFG
jgi:shikimate kinase